MNKQEKPYEIPFIVYESAIDRLERMLKRMWVLCIIIFIAFVASNGIWIWYEGAHQYVTETTHIEAEQDGDGVNIINDGDLNYGAESQDNKGKEI